MGFWDRVVHAFRGFFGLEPGAPSGYDAGSGFPMGPTAAGDFQPLPVRPRVLLITFNPIIASEGNLSLTAVLGWHDVDRLTSEYIADLRECSGGYLDYDIVERLEVNAWPVKADGFCYTADGFLTCWRTRQGWHDPDSVDYEAIIADFDLLARVESGQIDEVWLFAFPYAGFYESIMVGPGAFWCNSPGMEKTDGISRRFVIMGFNYERGVGPMLESFGHRAESILKHTWRFVPGEDNLWNRFIRHEKTSPGRANCGWMHYAPNSERDYDWGNMRRVLSSCDDWLNFPDLQGTQRLVDCRDWGNGDMRAHHKWWFKRLPKVAGVSFGVANNWWMYAADPNRVP